MTPEQYQRAKELFLELCEVEPAERRARLDALSDDDEPIRVEVLSLLRFHDQSSEGGVDELVDYASGSLVSDRYRIVSRLGGGGMGVVYRADDLVLGETVALKFLRPSVVRGDEQLLREVRLARQVSHPNVCRVFDVGTVDGLPFLSMEYVDGDDLASLLARIGRLPSSRAVPFAHQLFAGLAAAHARGVLHRDLKPANVMIDGRGQVKITDFGIATEIDDEDRVLLIGTPAYMAPEQLAGLEVTTRSDLYSLGVVLYEACTGEHPLGGGSRDDMLEAHLRRRPAPPSGLVDDLEPRLERLILQCLEKTPADRPSSALAAAAALGGGDVLDLAASVGDTPSPEMVVRAGGRSVLGRRGSRFLGVAAAVLLAVLFALTPSARRLDTAGLDLPPQALEVKAQELLASLGWDLEAADTASGWVRSSAAISPVEGATIPDPGAPGASTVYFWYRQSPSALVPATLDNLMYRTGQVLPRDPPAVEEGMVLLMLHPSGTLDHLEINPVERSTEAVADVDVGLETDLAAGLDVSAVLAAAGLDPERFTVEPGTFPPPAYADERLELVGDSAARPDLRLTVRLAGSDGMPVFVRVSPEPLGIDEPVEQDAWTPVALISSVIDEVWGWYDLVSIFVVVLAVPLAVRNLRRGRGDRRGAVRLAILLAAAELVEWIFLGPHIADLSTEWAMLNFRTARALLEVAWVWILYLALEPIVRRTLPHALVAWTRVLRGYWRDPLVGRSLAVGATVGVGWALLEQLDLLLPRWLGLAHWPPPVDSLQLDFASSAGATIGNALLMAHTAVIDALFSLLLFALLRRLVRGRTGLAIVLYASLYTALYVPLGVLPAVSLWTIGLPIALTEALVLARSGLLTYVAASFSFAVLRYFPLTLDVDAWYAGSGLFAGSLVAALVALGVYLARRPGPPPTDFKTSSAAAALSGTR